MPHSLINHNSDLTQLYDEGYVIEIRNEYLFIHEIPYLNSLKKIRRGILVTTLNYSVDKVYPPETHVIDFIGEFPCDKDGSKIIFPNRSSYENY